MLYFCSSVAITCLKFCVWRRYAAGILSHTYGLFTFLFLFQQTKLRHYMRMFTLVIGQMYLGWEQQKQIHEEGAADLVDGSDQGLITFTP